MPALPGAANARFFLRKEIGEGWGVRAPESSRSGASFHGTLQGIPEVGALEVVFFFRNVLEQNRVPLLFLPSHGHFCLQSICLPLLPIA